MSVIPPESISAREARRHAIVRDEIIIVVSHNETPSLDLYEPVRALVDNAHLVRFQEGRAHRFSLPGSGTPHREILFYKVVGLPAPMNGATERGRVEPLKDYIAGINASFPAASAHTIVVDNKRVTISFVVATPNVYAAASNDGGDSGSPAAPPVPVPFGVVPPWRFRFAEPLDDIVGAAQRGAVPMDNFVVAILDTCPDPAVLDSTAFVGNPLFDAVAGRAALVAGRPPRRVTLIPNPDAADAFSDMVEAIPDWPGYKTKFFALPEHDPDERKLDYGIANHGLFIAGMLKSILPDGTDIRLIQMLDDAGVAALDHVFAGLSEVKRIALREEKRVVVNMSWTTSTLSDDYEWAQPVYDTVFALFLDDVRTARVLCVAAAGNNNLTASALKLPRPPARYPAIYANPQPSPKMYPNSVAAIGFPNIVGVAATRLGWERNAARYSNKAPEIGVATIGGNARLVDSDPEHDILGRAEMTATEDGARWDGIAGIYGDYHVPFSDAPNETGWVYWAGTSFATPMIAAITAIIWANASGDTPPDAIIHHLVTDIAAAVGKDNGDLGTYALSAEQY